MVTLCLNDRDANLRPEHAQQVNWDKSHTYLYSEQIFLAHANGNGALPRFQDECFRFAAFRLPGSEASGVSEQGRDQLIKYLKGSDLIGYQRVIPPQQSNWTTWVSYEIHHLLTNNNAFNDAWENNHAIVIEKLNEDYTDSLGMNFSISYL